KAPTGRFAIAPEAVNCSGVTGRRSREDGAGGVESARGAPISPGGASPYCRHNAAIQRTARPAAENRKRPRMGLRSRRGKALSLLLPRREQKSSRQQRARAATSGATSDRRRGRKHNVGGAAWPATRTAATASGGAPAASS